MCDVTRRGFLAGGAAALGLAALEEEALARARRGQPEVGRVEEVTAGVYFHEGDLKAKGHCNNGWIVFEDYVLVIDANFPSGALEVIPKIRALTDRPIRFAFDTHHHGDHAYGNQVWVEHGAVPVAHTGVVEEMRRYEPGRWNEAAAGREDVRASRLKMPTLLFPKELYFDDGKRRVELVHLGVAHTHGDGWAWMPKEGILFSGDACVNGPYNFVGDGDVGKWIATLAEVKKLGAKIVCPGHGPRDAASLLDDQRAYFVALRDQVGALTRGNPPAEEVKRKIPEVKAALAASRQHGRFVGDFFTAQVEKVYAELTGRKLGLALRHDHARHHARQHGLA